LAKEAADDRTDDKPVLACGKGPSPSCARAAKSGLSLNPALAEKALTAVIQEAYFQGISTSSINDLVKTIGMSCVPKSRVSRVCKELPHHPSLTRIRERGARSARRFFETDFCLEAGLHRAGLAIGSRALSIR
jgi:hypothetical protein